MRHKEPQYPLDKYLPRVLKKDETFIKSREIPLRKDVSLFRKIESLLKESQCIREPIVNCVLAPNEAQLNVSSESSISTEDLVAAEFYKATYGTPKKADCSSKPKVAVPSHTKGAGDWVDPRTPNRWELEHEPQIENDCREGPTSIQLPWNGHNRMSALSPKTVRTETCFHPASLQTFESCGHYKMTIDNGFNMEETREVKKLNALHTEKPPPKLKISEACSFSSVPSVSIPSSSRLHNKSRALRKITVQNTGINTDRVNTHVFSMKHPDPEVVDDFAGQNRFKACVVQELPKVNIRARLVQQSCGFVSINPAHVPNEYENTAVVEVSHYNDQIEQPVGHPQPATEFSYSPMRHTDQTVQNSLNNQPPDSGDHLNHPKFPSKKYGMDRNHQPALSHRLAFDMGRRTSPQDRQSERDTKPTIFNTVSHFKEQLSRDFNSGFDSIKKSLSEMVSSLNDLCDIGPHNVQGLRPESSTFKANPLSLKDRVDRMDGILTEELNKWGQRDSAHYNLLIKTIDELTNEIKSAVDSFHRQQHLNERSNAFLDGSSPSTLCPNRATNQNTQKAVNPPDPLRLDKLYAIHSYLHHNVPSGSGTQGPPDSRFNSQSCGNLGNEDKFLTIKTKFDETFTIDPSPPDQVQSTNLQEKDSASGEKESSPQIENIDTKGETRGDYEDDFMSEDLEDDSESDSKEAKSDSSRSEKTAGDVLTTKADENLMIRTSGSANGEESTDAPLPQIAYEEPPSSVASTINASQANLKSLVKTCDVLKPISTQIDSASQVQKTSNNTDGSSDKPLVRLTNRNTNSVFELRLPEQLENLNSTLTYNSVGCNDEIKLSFGCSGQKEKVQTNKASIGDIDPLDKKIVPIDIHNKMDIGDSSSQPQQTYNNDPFSMKYAGMYNSGHLQQVESEQRATVSTETYPRDIRRVNLVNQATQFPSVDQSVEGLSASILTLVESKMNEMVEMNKQKIPSTESKFKDFSVQVVLGPEVGEERIAPVGLNTVAPQGLSSTNISTPAKAANHDQITPNVTPLHSDGYDSHPKNLDKPTDYLVIKQTERELEKMLARNSQFPVQLESTFSSVSLPTSLSEFPVKSSRSSSSELAFPLDEAPHPVTDFNDLRRLHPAPEFNYVNVDELNSDGQRAVELESHSRSLGDVSTHLHPNPEVAGIQTVSWGGAEEEIKEPNEVAECEMPVVAPPAHASTYEIQPYDSDLMSEGEVGYVYTSNSYSSGEIVERRKPSADVLPGSSQQRVDGKTCSGICAEPSIVDTDSCADETSHLNEVSSSSTETTTSETS